jgi:hypothetical protein
MQAEVESRQKKMDGMGWNTEKERASEVALRRAKNDVMRCRQVRVCPLLHMLVKQLFVYVKARCGAFEDLP